MPKRKATRPSEDIRPLSEARAAIAGVVAHVRETRRPVILTQHGRSSAVLLDVETYEDLLDEVELLRDVRAAEDEILAGTQIAHAKAKAEALRRLGR